jgi:hypothetical protein
MISAIVMIWLCLEMPCWIWIVWKTIGFVGRLLYAHDFCCIFMHQII